MALASVVVVSLLSMRKTCSLAVTTLAIPVATKIRAAIRGVTSVGKRER